MADEFKEEYFNKAPHVKCYVFDHRGTDISLHINLTIVSHLKKKKLIKIFRFKHFLVDFPSR